MTHRRLRIFGFLFNLLAGVCWGLAILMIVSNLKTASDTTFLLLSVVLPATLAVLFGVPASWFSRQKNALKERWEEQFNDADRVFRWTRCSLEYYEREVLKILWSGKATNTQLSREYITYRFKMAALAFRSYASFRASESIFEVLLKEGLVERDEKMGHYILSEKLVRGAKEARPLDDFSDPTVRVPFFTGRSFLQTA